jgi:YfiH family protein
MTDPREGRPDTPAGSVQTDPAGVLVVDLGPGVRAGFTGRGAAARTGRPGVAGGPAGNVGLGVGDDPDAVRRRRRAVAAWAGGPVGWVTQVHATGVALVAGGPDSREEAAGSPGTAGSPGAADPLGTAGSPGADDSLGEADAVVAVGPAGAAVVVADCVPLLLADPAAGVAAAVHAGRRGLADGVVQAAVAEAVRHGARVDRLHAAIGPSICGACYEVPAALRDEVADVMPGVAARTTWGTPSLDLPRGVAAVLAGLGVTRVHATGVCTMTHDGFFSHRRSTATGEPEGRFAGVVRIAGS